MAQASPDTAFDWQPQPAAAALIDDLLTRCLEANPDVVRLRDRLRDETGTRLVDWVDSLGVAGVDGLETALRDAGFAVDPDGRGGRSYRHPGGIFPIVHVAPHGTPDSTPSSLFVKVESVDAFRAAWEPVFGEITVSGERDGQRRDAWVTSHRDMQLHAIERHGWRSMSLPDESAAQRAAAARHAAAFAARPRTGEADDELFAETSRLFDAAADDLGRDWACDLFFTAERQFWMARNAAGRVQYARQQQLGLGWANHDHHTYRSSRRWFAPLVALFERMGFHCRERFYAGHEAGWGAQVLEQPNAGVVIFADVDLTPDEVMGDFAHEPLPDQQALGTIGLWCALHGEAILAAGMHHLECQFDFDTARLQLAAAGVETMTPFTDWPHLRQAFTRGERFTVADDRVAATLTAGAISVEQADQFRRTGAIGSHMEVLERNAGFKGFNQTGISEIITRTDPRKWVTTQA